MTRTSILIILITLLACTSVSAQEIFIKKSVFSDWKYSLDGHFYYKVGVSAKGLKYEMAGNEIAMAKMKAYTSNQTVGFIFTVLAGGALGVWLIAETESDIDKMPELGYAGLGFMVSMFIFEGLASKNLKAAVAEHNGETGKLSMKLGMARHQESNKLFFGPTFNYHF